MNTIKADVAFHVFSEETGAGDVLETRHFEVEAVDGMIDHPYMNLAKLVAQHIQRLEGSKVESLNLVTIRLHDHPLDIDTTVLIELVETLVSKGYWEQFIEVTPIVDERIS